MAAVARFSHINSSARVSGGNDHCTVWFCSSKQHSKLLLRAATLSWMQLVIFTYKAPKYFQLIFTCWLLIGMQRFVLPHFLVLHNSLLFLSVIYDVLGEGSSRVVAEVFSLDSSSVTAALWTATTHTGTHSGSQAEVSWIFLRFLSTLVFFGGGEINLSTAAAQCCSLCYSNYSYLQMYSFYFCIGTSGVLCCVLWVFFVFFLI